MVFIFDMDGVIVDNHAWHFKAWAEFGKRHGLNISEASFISYFGSTNHLVLKALFGNNTTEEKITAWGNEKETIYREIYKPFIKPVDGLPAFLKSAHKLGIPIALATSAPFENVKFTLEMLGIEKYFSVITDSSDVSRGKPDPQVYLITASKLGVQPADCVVFEDSFPGIESAHAASMRVIGVATTHKPVELLTYVNEIIMNFDVSEKLVQNLLQITVE